MASSSSSAEEELAMVERFLTRLVFTEDAQLEKVLSKLLPYAISLMSSSSNATRVKVTEMLSHINKRVKEQLSIKLPLAELLGVYRRPDAAVIVKNFSLVYIEMAFDRSTSEEQIAIVPEMLTGLASFPPLHRDIFLRTTAKALEKLSSDRVFEGVATKLKACLSSQDYPILFEFISQTLLYQVPSASQEGVPPPGLSLAQVARVCGKTPIQSDHLVPRKMGFLNLIAKMEVAPQDVYFTLLVASSDRNDLVAKRGEELLKKKASGVNMEDKTFVKSLFTIFLGTPANDRVPADGKVSAASPILKAKIMSALTHSVAAANIFPMTLQCIFDCFNGQATTKKLKQAGMEFTVWVFKHASSDQLKLMAPLILSHFIKFLDEKEIDPAMYPMRVFGYQAVGQLAQRAPHLFRSNSDMAKRLFRALQVEDASMRVTLQEAVNALAMAYKDCPPTVEKDIEDLLLENMNSVQGEVRFCVIFWATRLYKSSHVPSRYLCMCGAGDSKLDIRELSSEGLQITKGSVSSNANTYPPLKELMSFICEKQPGIMKPSVVGERNLLFPPKVYVAMVSYLMKCYELRTQEEEEIVSLRLLLEHGMAYEGVAELHALCSAGLLTLASEQPTKFAQLYAERIDWLKQFLGNIDVNTRESISRLLGIVIGGLDPLQASDLLKSFVEGTTKNRFENAHGSICSAGYALAQCRTGVPSVSEDVQQNTTRVLIRLLGSEKFQLGGFAAEALGHAGLRAPLAVPLGDLSKEEEVQEGNETLATVFTHFKKLLLSQEAKVVQRTVIAIGHLCFGNPLPELLDLAVEMLFQLKRSKVEDVLISVGEAMAFIWGVIPVDVDTILRSNFVSLSHSTNFFSDDPASVEDRSAKAVDINDQRKTSRDKILKVLLDELIFSSRKEERCAGSVWLLSLVIYCGRHLQIQALLPKIQEAFSYLLGEQNELTQEMASRGMSVVYELGDAATREELVKALVGTLSGTAKKKRPIKLMEDTEVFAEGSIGEAPGGGNISTYKELCNLANEMGQPDLVYKFMDLANYQASLNSRRGAAFGFAKIAKRAGDALEPHLRGLVPKLFRYQHDPNKNIQDAMGHIWRSLVAEPKKTIDMFYVDIMEDLLVNAGSRLWRSREAACAALADLIQGRKFPEVENYLLKMWTMAFRAMDDIKETVRSAGGILCRALSSLTLRLCDTSLTADSEARAAMGIVLPLLLSSGISSSVAEIQLLSTNLVMKLVKNAGRAIRPQLPDLVICMLESLSSLEDQRLNYAEMHAERLGISTDKLDSARFSLAKDSPMWDTLDFCLRQIDEETLESLVPRLVQLVRSGVGLNTRAGVARFIALLSQQVGSDLRQYAGPIMKVLIPTVISEKSTAAKKAFAAACAAVMKVSGDRLLEQLIADIVGFYKSGDKDSRIASGLLLKELSRQASDGLKQQATLVLPVAFIGRFDEEKSVRSDFEEVWEENTSSQTVALQLYMLEIMPLLLDGLATSSWTRKQQSAKAVIKAVEVTGEAAEPFAQQLMKSLLNELRGRTWEGKECIFEAISALCKGCPKVFTNMSEQADFISPSTVVETVIASFSRKKSSFRAAGYSCLEKVVEAFSDCDLFKLVASAVLDELAAKDTADSEKSADEPSKGSTHFEQAFSCLTASLKSSADSTVLEYAERVIASLLRGMNSSSWQVRLAALHSTQAFAEKCPGGVADEQSQEKLIPPILDCVSNVKVSQVHISALECLKATLRAILSVSSLGPDTARKLEARLREFLSVEKNVNGRSLISDMIGLLMANSSQSMPVD
ncbi:proteasome adapter and scaffold protein ECM29 [Selaginella moellendorffii]|uniref:proteasome adapter and scaffold protein ECM29 n=1 Tax=Selaginella moellendorffii TaxID=88036 RepID=UPI000D1C78E3|nr:proteasome adapter and scaffold protein ECM29 [Selaginella moellendorffii]|eukprot:XP_024544607.1 proteasome adapter and scaffold protein ECM29 [Selaginella moellendorffii]